mgnify:CR=1 FL=1
MPLLCVASASNNALRSFSSSSSKQRNLKDKLPSMCTGEQDSCTCKDFLANLKAATFQAANKTAWDKYQALSSYQKVLETEDTEKKCGKNENEETDCTLNFPKFPEDADYKKACEDIGGYLCTGVIIHERCTKYLHGGEDCVRTTNEQWVFPGDSVRELSFFYFFIFFSFFLFQVFLRLTNTNLPLFCSFLFILFFETDVLASRVQRLRERLAELASGE